MLELNVFIEINGQNTFVGRIESLDNKNACFTYDEEYIKNSNSRAISISLPLSNKPYDFKHTKNFFDGLLPEGFTRKCVAEISQIDADDYLSLLSLLGNECLGAIKIENQKNSSANTDYIELSIDKIQKLAQEGASEAADIVTKSHLSLTGASGKVGLYYNEANKKWYLPVGNAPSTHIVKQSHVRLKRIVANEQLCMLTAKALGIAVPESFIIKNDSVNDGSILFASKRYDRMLKNGVNTINGIPVPLRLHQEDFSQASGIPSECKYEKNNGRYLEQMFDLLRNYSADPIIDQLKLWNICIFNYLIGNTDNHIKNLSLLYSEDLKTIRLSPAYDIVSTMIYDSSSENMALSIGDKYNINCIGKEDFRIEAEKCGIGEKIAMKIFDSMVERFSSSLKASADILKNDGFDDVSDICKSIMKRGGIKHYRNIL